MRTIPIDLLNHKKKDATTLCRLIKISSKIGHTIGLTTLDIDVTYNDGTGAITYYAPVGFQPATIYESLGFEVSNSEFQSLVVPEYNLDLDEFSVNAGIYDYADFSMYEVNYEDLTQGHWVVMHGTIGQVRSVDGIQIFGEMRSITDAFRRNFVELDSLTCRARFGSQPGEDRFPCGFDASSLWIDSVVVAQSLENNRALFSDLSGYDTTSFYPTGFFEPGLIQFLTGNNAGKYIEIESFNETGEIYLSYPLSYVIEEGDTFRIRRDCNKRARDTAKGCKGFFGAEWGLHFRGEPDIPIADQGTLQLPNGILGSGTTDIITSDDEEPTPPEDP